MTLLALIAAPLILSYSFREPVASTPWFTLYEKWEFPPRWTEKQPEGARSCRDVFLTFSTQPGRTYHVECSTFPTINAWEVGKPNHVVNVWQRVSMPIAGDGAPKLWSMRIPWAWCYFRVVESP